MSRPVLLWAADGLALVACVVIAARLIRGQHEHERLYGRPRGWPRLHRPVFRRVPGLPRDGVLTGQEKDAIEVMEHGLRGTARRDRD